MAGGDPPDEAHVLELNSDTPDLAAVRRWAQSVLPELHEGDLLDVQLVITELVSNVYDHARFPAQVHVHKWAACVIKIAVNDASPAQPALSPSSPASARGRGLILVDRIARQWGVVRRALGKSVWAVIRTTGS